MENISERALVARINRALAKQYKAVRRFRKNAQGFDYHGRYYVLDTWHNSPIATHVNLETLGRELGVMGESESLPA